MPEEAAAAREAEYAARLLGFLRDLARARRRPSRDLAGHDHVEWLADLPGDVYVEADAGPGDVLFSVPVIPLTPPVVLEEFDGWLALRNWYRVLRELAGHEVVLATGLLSWRPAVHDHLLSTPVRIVVDERTERVDVVLTGHTTLRDRELLAGHPGFRPAGWIADAVQNGQGFGLNPSVGDVLRKWSQTALTGPAEYREDWTPGTDAGPPAPRIRLAPALVVRPPGRGAVADHHARLLALLPRRVPDGLARLVSPGRKPQVMHIPERAPETVPDLLAGMLARGHRVLVATSGPGASAALRAALPPGLAALTATDAATGAQVRDAISAARPDEAAAAEREKAAARRVAELTEQLDGESAAPPPDRRDEAPELSWLPVRPDLPPTPPISRSEAAELVVLLAEESPARKARTRQRDVDPGALPSAAYVRTLVDAEQAAAERAERARTDLSQRLRDSDVTLLARLDGDASVVVAALRDLGLDGHPGGWNPADLAVRAFSDALAERRPLIWARVVEMTSRAQWAERALAGLGGHRVELPADADLRGLAAAAQDLRGYLAGGGTLKRGPLRSAAQRQAETLLATVTVDGAAPTTAELLHLAHTDLMVRITCRELQYVWEAAGISFPADLPPAERIARFVRAHARLARVRDAMPAVDSTRTLLDRNGFGVSLGHPAQWHAYATALRNALEGLGVNRATADLDALRDSLGPPHADDPPELGAAVAAIEARDAAAYGRALGALAEARHERALQIRCTELLDRVRAVHPDLANLMIATDGDEAWHDRTRRWDDAWAWARRAATAAPPPPARTELAAAEEELGEARAALATAQAWTAATALADVPAWILPLWRIPDVLPPEPDSFDAVIVDGEHEAGAEALFVLWLAPRAVLVGPAGADLPPPEGPLPATRLPPHLHETITPTTTLFTALTGPRTEAEQQDPAPAKTPPRRLDAPPLTPPEHPPPRRLDATSDPEPRPPTIPALWGTPGPHPPPSKAQDPPRPQDTPQPSEAQTRRPPSEPETETPPDPPRPQDSPRRQAPPRPPASPQPSEAQQQPETRRPPTQRSSPRPLEAEGMRPTDSPRRPESPPPLESHGPSAPPRRPLPPRSLERQGPLESHGPPTPPRPQDSPHRPDSPRSQESQGPLESQGPPTPPRPEDSPRQPESARSPESHGPLESRRPPSPPLRPGSPRPQDSPRQAEAPGSQESRGPLESRRPPAPPRRPEPQGRPEAPLESHGPPAPPRPQDSSRQPESPGSPESRGPLESRRPPAPPRRPETQGRPEGARPQDLPRQPESPESRGPLESRRPPAPPRRPETQGRPEGAHPQDLPRPAEAPESRRPPSPRPQDSPRQAEAPGPPESHGPLESRRPPAPPRRPESQGRPEAPLESHGPPAPPRPQDSPGQPEPPRSPESRGPLESRRPPSPPRPQDAPRQAEAPGPPESRGPLESRRPPVPPRRPESQGRPEGARSQDLPRQAESPGAAEARRPASPPLRPGSARPSESPGWAEGARPQDSPRRPESPEARRPAGPPRRLEALRPEGASGAAGSPEGRGPVESRRPSGAPRVPDVPRRLDSPRRQPRPPEEQEQWEPHRPPAPPRHSRPADSPRAPEAQGGASSAGEERREEAGGPAKVRRGQSIVGYKRPELVEIVGRIAEREPDLTDEQLVELVARLLGCPEDEALLVGARLRYAVETYRQQSGG
ncbi:hypothetical protein ACFYYL_15555 [Actinomadura geliboluensis]|uniref:hypothetical protein n=1 Tax=Actinomadura geliboluensis TaxID=882440 RepID=UPI0036ACAC7B